MYMERVLNPESVLVKRPVKWVNVTGLTIILEYGNVAPLGCRSLDHGFLTNYQPLFGYDLDRHKASVPAAPLMVSSELSESVRYERRESHC